MTGQPAFEQVRPVRLYERIVEQVEAAVASGQLAPGQRLPSERELVTQFGTSRATVREALRVLESNGVVRSRPGDPNGPEILPFSARGLSKQLRRLARAEELTLAQLLVSRMMLDATANRLAAVLRTDDQLADMEAAIGRMRRGRRPRLRRVQRGRPRLPRGGRRRVRQHPDPGQQRGRPRHRPLGHRRQDRARAQQQGADAAIPGAP